MSFTSDFKMRYKIDADATKAKAEIRDLDGLLNSLGGGLPGPLGKAGPILGTVAASITAAGGALFTLAKQASDFGSAIKDVQDKTGLSAEALTTLKFAAEQSGVAFDSLTAPISKFSKLIGEANRVGGEARKTLEDFGIDGRRAFEDIDYAVTAALDSLLKFPEGTQRNDAAIRLFGKSGANLNAVLQSLGKDGFGEAIKRAKELGVTLSQEDIDAADAFGDTLGALGRQAQVIASKFATGFMPEITAAMNGVSAALSRNKDDVRAWGESVGTTLRGLKNISAEIYEFAQTPSGRALQLLLFGHLIATKNLIDLFAGPPSAVVTPPPPFSTKRPGGYDTDSEEEKREAEKRRQKREQDFQKEVAAHRDRVGIYEKANRDGYTASQKELEESYLQRGITEKEFLEKSLGNIAKYAGNVRTLLKDALSLDSIGKTPYEQQNLAIKNAEALAALAREEAAARTDVHKTVADANKKAADERRAAAEKENDDLDALNQARAERRIAALEYELELGLIAEKEFARKLGEIQLELLESQRARETDLHKRAILDDQITTQKLRNARMVLRAIRDENAEIDEQAKAYDRLRESVWKAAMAQAELNAQNAEWIESLRAAQPLEQAMEEVGDMFTGAIQQWTTGMGQLIESWVLYGEVGPDAVRKVTAQVLASLAAQAAAKALFYTAEGIAALFFDPPLAAAFFTAAGIMAAIAGGAALAGRAVAGDSFKKGRSGSGERSSSQQFGSGRPERDSLTPYSRESSSMIYQSGRDRAIDELRRTIDRLENKIGSMRPGDVLTSGIREKRNLISDTVISEARSGKAVALAKALPQ